jgi:FixJ family two-component response regulator
VLRSQLERFGQELRRIVVMDRQARTAQPSTPEHRNGHSAALFEKQPLISIIDDDRSVREALKKLVRCAGYSGAAFASAEEYLRSDVLRDNACLICDVQLAGMSGPDLQGRLIAEGYRIPIIFVSGHFNESTRARVLACGAVAYLAKPCDAISLIDHLRKGLGLAGVPR